QISPVLDRRATLVQGTGGEPDVITLTGTISCTRSEPVDLFPRFAQGSVEDSGEISVPCGPGAPQVWSRAFEVDPAFNPGPASADVGFCTNPGEHIDEDCVSVGRTIALVVAP